MSRYPIAIVVLLIAFAGCGDGGPERVVVAGRVTLNGAPVDNGFIRFFPIKGTAGPMWGAQITDGEYRADGKGGVPVGTHRVEIEAFRKVKNAQPAADVFEDFGGEGPATLEEQVIPAHYNSQSTLEITVETGQGEIRKDFELTD
jgi:hypothetical protein